MKGREITKKLFLTSDGLQVTLSPNVSLRPLFLNTGSPGTPQEKISENTVCQSL